VATARAVSGRGVYITLEDGREVIDAVGGAAVVCIGNGHPVVQEAIKEQVDKLAVGNSISISGCRFNEWGGASRRIQHAVIE